MDNTADVLLFAKEGRGDRQGVEAAISNGPHWASELQKAAPAHKNKIKAIHKTLASIKKDYKSKGMKDVRPRLETTWKKLIDLNQKLSKSCGR